MPYLANINNRLTEIIKYRELVFNLVFRELADRYKRSSLGLFWAIIEPLGLMGIYAIIFSIIVRLDIPDYPVFLLCGILPWIYFSKALIYCTESIIKDSHLVKKIYFPRETLPISSVFARFVNFIISLFILMVFLVVFKGLRIDCNLLWLAPIIFTQTVFSVGIALALSCLSVYFRDIKILIEFVALVWFYLTPVFYPLSMVPDALRKFYILNPMAGIVSSYRGVLLEGKMPLNAEFLIALAISIFIFIAGFAVFGKLNRRIGELV